MQRRIDMIRRRQVVVVTAVVVVVLGLLALLLLFNSSGTNDVSDEPASGAPRESSTTQQKTIDTQPLIPGFKTVEFEGLVAQVPTDWPVRYLTVGNGCEAYDVPAVNFDARDPDTIDHEECGDIGSLYMNSLFIGKMKSDKYPSSPTVMMFGAAIVPLEDSLWPVATWWSDPLTDWLRAFALKCRPLVRNMF